MSHPPIVVTTQDYDRLHSVLEPILAASTSDHLELLVQELERAQVVPPHELAPDVVSMNSEFVYEDLATGKRRAARLVYPGEADIDRGWISVFAPLGSALLGLRVGHEIDWAMPSGVRRLKVIEISYQPEAAGDLSL